MISVFLYSRPYRSFAGRMPNAYTWLGYYRAQSGMASYTVPFGLLGAGGS